MEICAPASSPAMLRMLSAPDFATFMHSPPACFAVWAGFFVAIAKLNTVTITDTTVA